MLAAWTWSFWYSTGVLAWFYIATFVHDESDRGDTTQAGVVFVVVMVGFTSAILGPLLWLPTLVKWEQRRKDTNG